MGEYNLLKSRDKMRVYDNCQNPFSGWRDYKINKSGLSYVIEIEKAQEEITRS